MQNFKKDIQSLTQTTSKPFLLVGQIMNKIASRYPAIPHTEVRFQLTNVTHQI